MITVKIAFNPADLKEKDEAWPAFQAGGMVLKFWALWKRHHCTSQHFRPALERLADYYDKDFDKEDESERPYADIDEFLSVLRRCRFTSLSGFVSEDLRAWILRYWDHFNLNIQKAVVLEYEAVEPVTKHIAIGAAA